MFKKQWFGLLILMMLALLLAACGGGAQPEVEQPADTAPAQDGQAEEAKESTATGGTARVGWGGSPDTLNPGTAVVAESYTLFGLIYDRMFKLELDGTFSPQLADSWEVSDDGKVYTFKIHQPVKFHDGQPLTAKDVVFSYNFYHSHDDFLFLNTYTELFEKVEAPDDGTVVLTLSEAVPNIDYLLGALYVLPEHIWSQHAEGAAATEYENPEMIGSGPFKLVEYKQNESVHLAANKDHFQSPPKIDEVVFQTFGNQDALVQALVTGQVDMINEMPSTAVPILRNTENVELVIKSPASPEVDDIIINQVSPENCPKDEGGVCSGHPALLDRNVRLALAHATDKQNLIDVVLFGLGTPGLTLIPDGLGAWYNNTLKDYEFDIAKANQILDEAGYKDTDGDGVREMPDGSQPLTFRINWPNDSAKAPRVAELLSENWGQIGVKTQPQAMDPDALTSACCPAFDFDIILWGWGSDPDPNLLLSVMTTGDIPTGNNESGYSNPEFDKLFEQQAIEADQEKRRELVWKMQEIVHNDVAYIIPFYPQATQAFRTDRFKDWATEAPRVELEAASSLTVITPVQ